MDHGQYDPRQMGGIMINPYPGLFEVFFSAGRDIDKGLGIQVHQGEQTALYLHHDPMAFFKSMGDLIQFVGDLGDLSGCQGFGFFPAVPEFTTEDFRPHQALVAAGAPVGRSVLTVRENIYQLNNQVGVRTGGTKKDIGL